MMEACFLAGPTAAGKSAVAHCLALQEGWAVLTADSMQVYRGMDIGTAKPSRADRDQVVYGGVDLVDPDTAFSVADYRDHALCFLRGQTEAGRRVMVAGGSGLYLKALTHGMEKGCAPDAAFRQAWMQRVASEGLHGLQSAWCRDIPAARRNPMDAGNVRRMIRALEKQAGAAAGDTHDWKQSVPAAPMVGLALPPEELARRIENRVDQMYGEGLLDEVRQLLETWPEWSPTASQAIGYAEAAACVQGRLSLDEARARTVIRTRQLAKKQRTWFRHQAETVWVTVESGMPAEQVAEQVREAWRQYGSIRIVT